MSIDSKVLQIMKSIRPFSAMSDAEVLSLVSASSQKSFCRGELIFRFGDVGRCLYVILSGRVNIEKATKSGKTLHITTRSAGEFFGELALVDARPRMADAVAATACKVLVLPQGPFTKCLEENASFQFALLQAQGDRLRDAATQLESRQEFDAIGLVAEALLRLARTSGEAVAPAADAKLKIHVTHQTLAELTGLARETVSRAMSALRAVNAVTTVARSVTVISPEILDRYISD